MHYRSPITVIPTLMVFARITLASCLLLILCLPTPACSVERIVQLTIPGCGA